MKIRPAGLEGALLFEMPRNHDARGYFSETFREDCFEAAAGRVRFVQDNESLSAAAGTLRGLHFQLPPKAQGKLVRCTRGSIRDVALDVRPGSPSHGRHIVVELSAENGRQLWLPSGLAHGFLTLEADTVVAYKVTAFYDAGLEVGIRWNDPALAIDWGLPGIAAEPCLSAKDRSLPLFSELRERIPADWGLLPVDGAGQDA